MSRSVAHDQRNAAFLEAFKKPLDFAATAPPTADTIATETQKQDIQHKVEDVPASQGARLHWLGDSKVSKVLLYFHGGGFNLSILPGHVSFLKQSMDRVGNGGTKFVVAALEYGLAPELRYPGQIKQGVEALRHLLRKGYKPSDIAIGGDSAGGNLTLAVLSVYLHGFEGIEPFELQGKLAGILLICPWVSLGWDSPSWSENAGRDVIPKECPQQMTPNYVDESDRNKFSEPAMAKEDWWLGIPAEKILNVYGGYEVLLDSQREIGDKLAAAGNAVKNVKCDKQVHIDCVLDAQTELEPGEMSNVIWQWLGDVW